MASIILSVLVVCVACQVVASLDTRFLVFFKTPDSCAGTIVAPHWVITAAHCCYNSSDPKHYWMLAGLPQHYQQRQGQELYIHPNGTADKPDEVAKAYDFALFKVHPSWTLGQYVRVIHMFFGSFPRYPILNNECFAAGWNRKVIGLLDNADKKKPIPYAYELTTVVSEQCGKKLNITVFDNNLCAQDQFASWDGSETDFKGYPCTGDVGGPLVCDIFTAEGRLKPMLCGVLSSYRARHEVCSLALYAGTSALGNWMHKHVPDIARQDLDAPLRSRIQEARAAQNVASSSRGNDADEYSMQVVFRYSGVTVLIAHGSPARRVVSMFLSMMCFMRIATFLVVFFSILERDHAWRRFGYIVSI